MHALDRKPEIVKLSTTKRRCAVERRPRCGCMDVPSDPAVHQGRLIRIVTQKLAPSTFHSRASSWCIMRSRTPVDCKYRVRAVLLFKFKDNVVDVTVNVKSY